VNPTRLTLPPRRCRLIGRETELAAVSGFLLNGDARLVTLVGAGGAGKTTLALEVARLADVSMPDGVALIDLTSVQEPAAVTLACCEALGLVDQHTAPAIALTRHLRPRQLLLVLDNCEHLVAPVRLLVDRLLDACPDLRVLASSRTRLGLRGESVYQVPPLQVPDVWAGERADELARIPAVELFVERATELDATFSLAYWGPAVVSICHRLDGLPLALELAAAQLTALTPSEVARRLGSLLGRDLHGHGPSAGQRALDAVLDRSYDLLDGFEQVLFRRLAVFNGGWTLDAAEQVCALGSDPATIAPALVSLVEHSLVVREGHCPDRRFRMLAPIAEYAGRRLAASEEASAVFLAHATYYLDVISGGGADWREVEPEHLDLIATEYDNCLAAMRFAEREALVPIVLGYNLALLLFWRVRGLLRSGMRRLEAALPLVGEAPSQERGMILAGLAHYGQLLGEPGPAADHAAQSQAVFEAIADPIGRRTVLGFVGDIAADQGDLDGALAAYEQARALIDDDTGALDRGLVHANIGRVRALAGDPAVAERELEVALGHLRRSSGWYQGHVLVQLGTLARRRADRSRAETLLGEAIGHLHAYGATLEAASCLAELARLSLDRADHRRAATLLAAATGLEDAAGRDPTASSTSSLAADIERARAGCASDAFAAAWSRGRGLPLHQAVALVTGPDVEVDEPPPQRHSVLTPREHQIAKLVAEGLTNRQIAQRLVIAPGTVKTHVERILGKLGMNTRVQIATWVSRDHNAPTS
jgi:predicted ATPase/DNA-binding CsgD family transcriptional regulator